MSYISFTMDDQFYRKENPTWRQPERWIKKLFKNKLFKWGIIPFLILITVFLISDKGPLKRSQLEQEKKMWIERIKEANEEQKRLQQESKALDKDKFAIEKAAREKHGMVKEGDTIYKLKESDAK
ncbi:MAG: septum formation initiator family protein [Bacteroidota bacterium]|nr:septum formation initiator family protein [Bacteroidota bacterium]